MAFEIRKISDVGTNHPVVARLGVQTSELISWLHLDKNSRDAIVELYAITLTQRLLRCHQIRDDLMKRIADEDETITKAKEAARSNDGRVKHIPNVVGLQGIVEGFLYEAKNYLRDLLDLFRVIYDCDLKDASALADLQGKGASALVKWSIATLGRTDHLTKLLETEQPWTTDLIRMRNAAEHPGGHSGTMILQNCRVHPQHPESYIPPTWRCGDRPESDIVTDMDISLDNMLTFAEDLLVHAVMHKGHFKGIAFYQIPSDQRDPNCPIRLRVGLSPELQAKLGR